MENKNSKMQEFLTAMGAIGEISALLRDILIKNGFTREEAVSIVSQIFAEMFKSFGGHNK